MARYNKATKMMIDLAFCDIWDDWYPTTAQITSAGVTLFTDVEVFKAAVLRGYGLTDDEIELKFANNYDDDALQAVAIQTFIAQVNWGQVLTKYKGVLREIENGKDGNWFYENVHRLGG